MSGSAFAGDEGTKPTVAIMATPDSRVMSRFRPFSTSVALSLHVVRLPGELTDSGTTLPYLRICGGFTPVVVPWLAATGWFPGSRAGEPVRDSAR